MRSRQTINNLFLFFWFLFDGFNLLLFRATFDSLLDLTYLHLLVAYF